MLDNLSPFSKWCKLFIRDWIFEYQYSSSFHPCFVQFSSGFRPVFGFLFFYSDTTAYIILKTVIKKMKLMIFFIYFGKKISFFNHFNYRRFQNGVRYLFVIEYSNTNIRPIFIHVLFSFHLVFVWFSVFFFFIQI